MRKITRWTLAVLALIGFHSAVAQAQEQHRLTNSDHTNVLSAGTVDFEATGGSDGSTVP